MQVQNCTDLKQSLNELQFKHISIFLIVNKKDIRFLLGRFDCSLKFPSKPTFHPQICYTTVCFLMSQSVSLTVFK